MRKLLLLNAFLLVIACQNSTQTDEAFGATDKVVQTANNKQLILEKHSEWKNRELLNYKFIWKSTCFCPSEYTRPIKVSVVNGVINSSHYADNGQLVNSEVAETLKTIDEIYKMLEKHIEISEVVSVRYADNFPIPQKLFIDRDKRMADEEIQISISELSEL